MEIVAYFPSEEADLFLKTKREGTVSYNLIRYADYDGTKEEIALKKELELEIKKWLKENNAKVEPDNISQIIGKTLPHIRCSQHKI